MFSQIKKEFMDLDLCDNYGKVSNISGNMIESIGPTCRLGDICYTETSNGRIMCEVVSFNGEKVSLMAYEDIYGISPGDKVYTTKKPLNIKVGDDLIGRVLNGVGLPLDEQPIYAKAKYSIYAKPVPAFDKAIISERLELGIKAIDTQLPIGKGQRISINAGSGVGKSTLLGSIVKNSKADLNVLALIGERGRELQEFIQNELGEEGMKRSIVVVATSDQPAIMKIKAAYTATTIAEYFRDQGLDVMLMMDSVTRFAEAQREIGISVGEKVATKGFTPSVFALIPKLLERAGTSKVGSITGIYTVLVEGDDMNGPIVDCIRGILDGHIVLSRNLANSGHFPAIDILSSVSRTTHNLLNKEQIKRLNQFRDVLQTYKDVEVLLSVGSYKKGVDLKTDRDIELYPLCMEFLKQDRDEYFSIEESELLLNNLLNK